MSVCLFIAHHALALAYICIIDLNTHSVYDYGPQFMQTRDSGVAKMESRRVSTPVQRNGVYEEPMALLSPSCQGIPSDETILLEPSRTDRSIRRSPTAPILTASDVGAAPVKSEQVVVGVCAMNRKVLCILSLIIQCRS